MVGTMKTSIWDAQQTYDRAVELFKDHYTQDESKRRWLQSRNSLEEVQLAVTEAKAKYDARSQSSVRRYVQKVSSTMMFYSSIMDMLAQHHPEYVSLAWGTTKLLFVLILNHEQLNTELAKSLASIADALPNLEGHLSTYATKEMLAAAEDLYALLISFYQRALRWYEARPWKHAMKAFLKTYPLQFEDLVQRIQRRAIDIEKQAIVMAHKDIAQILPLVKECLAEQKLVRAGQQEARLIQNNAQSALSELEQSKIQAFDLLTNVKELLIAHQTVNSGNLLATRRVTKETQVAMMISFTASTSLPTPLDNLQGRRRWCIKSQASKISSYERLWQCSQIRAWAQSKKSTLLLLNGTASCRSQAQTVATLMTELLRSRSTPVIWALKAADRSLTRGSASETLKYLTMQALQLDPTGVGESISAAFNAALLASARSEKDWLQILGTLFSRHPFVHIVLEVEMLGPSDSDEEELRSLLHLLQEQLLTRSRTVIKIALISYRRLTQADERQCP